MTAKRKRGPSVSAFIDHQHAKSLRERGAVLRPATVTAQASHIAMAEARCDGPLAETLADREATASWSRAWAPSWYLAPPERALDTHALRRLAG